MSHTHTHSHTHHAHSHGEDRGYKVKRCYEYSTLSEEGSQNEGVAGLPV